MNTARWTAYAFMLSMMMLSGGVEEQPPVEPVSASVA